MRQLFKPAFLRRPFAIFTAVVTTVVLGVIFQTQNVLSTLTSIGADISFIDRVSMTAYDVFYLGKAYAIFVTVALLIAFILSDFIANRIKFAQLSIYMLGGAIAILVMLFTMKMKFFGIHILSGARDTLGIGLQMLAGAMGGLVFAKINRRKSTAYKSEN